MENVELIIPDANIVDFTIIYKGNDEKNPIIEIKTLKDNFLSKLQHFKKKKKELEHVDEIYIHDKFSNDTFSKFIESICTKRLSINESNYNDYYELSSKYEYQELLEEIKRFINERPDLTHIIGQLSSDHESIFDKDKEELISKNLDFCFKHLNLSNIPLSTLNRILNSPKRVLNDFHLLFRFIINKIKNCQKKETNEDSENVEILMSCLDYNQMTSEEIEELISLQNSTSIFSPRNSISLMKTLNEELKEMKQQNLELHQQISSLLSSNEELLKKMQEKDEVINKQQSSIDDLQQKITELSMQINKLQINYESIDHKLQTSQINENDNENEHKNVKQKINNEIASFIYEEGKEFLGIINHFNNETNKKIEKKVKITGSSASGSSLPQNVALFNKTKRFCSTGNESNPWICFEFIENQIIPTSYIIKTSNSGSHPRSWIFEGSNDNNNWQVLDEQNNCNRINKNCTTQAFILQNQKTEKFRYLRMKLTEKNWGCNNILVIDSFEIYGTIL